MTAHHFWLLITVACLAWYVTITFYIAWRRALDIRQMFRRLSKLRRAEDDDTDPAAAMPD